MASLCALMALVLLTMILNGMALALAARAAGSARGRFRVGLAITVILMVVNVGLIAVGSLFSALSKPVVAVLSILMLLAQMLITFFVLRRGFGLSVKRTFVPFAGLIGMAAVQIVAIQFLFKPYVAEAFVIPTRSMLPTIAPGDRFFVNKMLAPRRWDLVAYWSRVNGAVIYCKRLVGLPGETIKFENGAMFVNGHAIEAPAVVAGKYHASPEGITPSQARYRDGEAIELKGDEYFLIGDNVDLSADSREYGPTSRSDLVGVADLMYWPLNRIQFLR